LCRAPTITIKEAFDQQLFAAPDDPNGYPGAPTNCAFASNDHSADLNCNGIEDWLELNCGEAPGPPILIDLENRFAMTNNADGVLFDLDSEGRPERLSWTAAEATAAWLALDRNGNGVVDNGSELFGTYSPQPASVSPNGFRALGLYDYSEFGGNGDGLIDQRDAVLESLLLWRDRSHDGQSQAAELSRASVELRDRSLSLHFKLTARRDRFGTVFRYMSRLFPFSANNGAWLVDVLLTRTDRHQRLVDATHGTRTDRTSR
jgi:hypothetical protein